MSVPFPPNTTFFLTGATSSGKSCWVHRFLKNISHMFGDTPTEKILYCYGVYQLLFDQMREDVPNLMFHRGLPDVEEIEALSGHSLLILDGRKLSIPKLCRICSANIVITWVSVSCF